MKIGKLKFKDYAAKKPVTVSPLGTFLTADEVVGQPVLSLGSLHALDTNLQMKLAVRRYELEPDFKLGVIGVGVLSKKEVIQHIKKQTDFGQLALQAEMGYCNELLSTLTRGRIPAWPKLPARRVPEKPYWKPVKRCIWLRLKNRALFCENTTDSVTTPFANYRSKNVIPVFKKRGFTVIVLSGTDDIRTNFIPEAKNLLTVYLSGIGHGNYTLYTGHSGNRILEACNYDNAEVKSKSIHFLSCRTAAKLGPDTVKKGAHSYAGYTENFILQWDDSSTPVNEFVLFARSDSTYDIAMANGATAQQAYDHTIQAFNAAINQVPNQVAATYLKWDRDHLKLHGDTKAKIKPERFVRVCFPLVDRAKENALVEAGELMD
jgi:hypothetical protein